MEAVGIGLTSPFTHYFMSHVSTSRSMPVLVILEAQLLSMERRAALLWRADRAGVLVGLVVPFLSPDDTRLQLRSLTFVATIIRCLPSDLLYASALKSIPKEGDRHQCVGPSRAHHAAPYLVALRCACVQRTGSWLRCSKCPRDVHLWVLWVL